MFSVTAIVSRGWFRDRVLIAAGDDIRQSRTKLGWDVAGAPEVRIDTIQAATGQEFEVKLPKRLAAIGQTFSYEQVAEWPAFDALWQPAVGE